MPIHESGQMYLETIYILSQKSTYVRQLMWASSWAFPSPALSGRCLF